jgi:hypothetical protein
MEVYNNKRQCTRIKHQTMGGKNLWRKKKSKRQKKLHTIWAFLMASKEKDLICSVFIYYRAGTKPGRGQKVLFSFSWWFSLFSFGILSRLIKIVLGALCRLGLIKITLDGLCRPRHSGYIFGCGRWIMTCWCIVLASFKFMKIFHSCNSGLRSTFLWSIWIT